MEGITLKVLLLGFCRLRRAPGMGLAGKGGLFHQAQRVCGGLGSADTLQSDPCASCGSDFPCAHCKDLLLSRFLVSSEPGLAL